MLKTQKVCQNCGKNFWAPYGYYYCTECAKKRKTDTVVRIRTCQDCGVEFFGGPRARRCPDCAYEAKKESTRHYKKNGPQRKIGSIDKCERCGKEYVVSGGRQKYCDDCKREALLEWQRPRKREYNKMTNQKEKKKERRRATEKVCVYCGRKFSTTTTTTLCSDYCRERQQKYRQCINDINRGHKRRLDILEKEREEYREEVKKNQ